jgi:hypothetical protein
VDPFIVFRGSRVDALVLDVPALMTAGDPFGMGLTAKNASGAWTFLSKAWEGRINHVSAL